MITIVLDCDGCPDNEDIQSPVSAHIDDFVSGMRKLGWAEIPNTADAPRHYCPTCVSYIQTRESDDELQTWDIDPADAKRYIDTVKQPTSRSEG